MRITLKYRGIIPHLGVARTLYGNYLQETRGISEVLGGSMHLVYTLRRYIYYTHYTFTEVVYAKGILYRYSTIYV